MISSMTAKERYLRQELYFLSSDIFIIETYLKYYPYKEEEKKLLKEELDHMIEYKEILEKELRGEVNSNDK